MWYALWRAMPDEGFYRRPLPPPLVPFASVEGRALFREALDEGHLEGWFSLAEQFHTQADPAFCGLGTLVVALNALGVDPGRLWKGPWRWYSEELLDCCVSLERVRDRGITLDQFSCFARCNGATAELRRAADAALETLRADLREAASAPGGLVLAAPYSRRVLGQTGGGHFSPIAGFHARRDLALVLDVARFKYPPHWVPVPMLWEAMLPHDPATGRSRGWVLLRRRPLGAALLFHLSDARLPWADVARRLLVDVPAALAAAGPPDAPGVVRAFVRSLPPDAPSMLGTFPVALEALAPEHRDQARALLETLRATPLHAEVRRVLDDRAPGTECPPQLPEFMTMLLFALPDRAFASVAPAPRAALGALRGVAALAPLLRSEVEVLREQVAALESADGPLEGARQGPSCP